MMATVKQQEYTGLRSATAEIERLFGYLHSEHTKFEVVYERICSMDDVRRYMIKRAFFIHKCEPRVIAAACNMTVMGVERVINAND